MVGPAPGHPADPPPRQCETRKLKIPRTSWFHPKSAYILAALRGVFDDAVYDRTDRGLHGGRPHRYGCGHWGRDLARQPIALTTGAEHGELSLRICRSL